MGMGGCQSGADDDREDRSRVGRRFLASREPAGETFHERGISAFPNPVRDNFLPRSYSTSTEVDESCRFGARVCRGCHDEGGAPDALDGSISSSAMGSEKTSSSVDERSSDDVLRRTSSRQSSISRSGGSGSRYGRSQRCSLEHEERRLKSKLPTPVPSVNESMSFSLGAGGGWSGRGCHSAG
jgi:hypothetical protein